MNDDTEMNHWADPAFVVETADGEYTGHSGREELAKQLARDKDESRPENAPHTVRKTSFEEVHEIAP